MSYQKIGSLKGLEGFRAHLHAIAPEVPVDDDVIAGDASPLAAPAKVSHRAPDGKTTTLDIGNRWTIHPMEGWDGTDEGNPSEFTRRRWKNFGLSGAKLIWGGEAVAIQHAGRANPNQLLMAEHTLGGLENLRTTLVEAHEERYGSDDGLLVGLQLTHSGRFCRPNRKDLIEPRAAYHHPILDRRFGGAENTQILSDAEVEQIIADFVSAAVRAQEMGYQFVDIKHCHGYLLHEFLGAKTRPGPYGGSFENRTRILREVVAGIRRDAPDLPIGVRVSIFDRISYRPDPDKGSGRKLGPGIPDEYDGPLPFPHGFCINPDDPADSDLEEGYLFLELLRSLGIELVNISGGSPYYNPHIQRPALYPPSDGYQPPEDPLIGVVRHLRILRQLKERFGDLYIIGSALSYLQDYFPQVAQAVVRDGWMDSVGLGRMVLSYWDLPGDCLEGNPLQKRRFCRTFSDCTTAPRNGLISGCFPLDKFYQGLPEMKAMKEIKSRN